ncbi:hypothetical protein [Desulfobacter curvatus]|uniref:hypothetical protein n=1 Tax=Desulfobacter curvatus TaxID=2290 RepID=UPI0003813517|nr:hypothetical protein [Desulfobacter curvatus]
MNDLLNKISPDEALNILKILAKTDKEIKKKIFNIAENIIKDVDYELVSDDVFWALDTIDVHELWNSSGSTVDGYISTDEMAYEMISNAIEPFQKEIFRFIDMGMTQEAKLYCMGVLKGIYMYESDSNSEFKDWAVDIPGECFRSILHKWEKRSKKKSDMKAMNEFLMRECSNWIEE